MVNATDQTAMNGRIQNGTFAPGNKAAAGRSSRAMELRKAFVDAVSVEDIQAIAAALVKSAKDGDISAAKLVLDRLGKVDHDKLALPVQDLVGREIAVDAVMAQE